MNAVNNDVKRASENYFRIAITYHEASHAICGLFNFLRMYHIYVMRKEEGNALYETYDLDLIEDELLVKIIAIYEVQTLYAGLIGEQIYYKEICGSDKFPMHLKSGSSSDMQKASKLIKKYNLALPGKARSIFRSQIKNDANVLLQEYWEDIKLLAHALYQYQEMKLEDIKYVLTRRSDNKEFWKNRFKEINHIYSERKNLKESEIKDILLQNSVIIL